MIDKDVPIPKTQSGIYAEMEVGDSLLINAISHKDTSVRVARSYFYKNGKKCKCRKEAAGIRVWRTK